MRYCPECGSELAQAGAHFCPECGVQIAQSETYVPEVEGATAPVIPTHDVTQSTLAARFPRWAWIAVVAGLVIVAVVGLLTWNAVSAAQRQARSSAEAALLATVPDVRGLTAPQATERVRAAGLEMGQTNYDPSAIGAVGAVVKEDPAPNARTRKGSLVVVTVVGAQPVNVPNFVGLESNGAQAAAAAVGLNVLAVQTSSSSKAGTVISQAPAAGTSVQPGSSVNIMVAKGASSTASGANSNGTYTPKKGSAERTAIMDACRIYLDYSGLFIVNELKVRSSRAFASLTPNDNRAWGAIGMYLLKNGSGWIVSTDSRTAAARGSFVSEDAWLFNK